MLHPDKKSTFQHRPAKFLGRLKESMVNGLLAFKADYPEAETRLVYRGRERIKIKGVLCVPCAEFLVNMVPGKPFWLERMCLI